MSPPLKLRDLRRRATKNPEMANRNKINPNKISFKEFLILIIKSFSFEPKLTTLTNLRLIYLI